jgi:hypothetical protein
VQLWGVETGVTLQMLEGHTWLVSAVTTVGRRDERHSVDTKRPYGLRQHCSVLTGQQDGGVSIVG